MYEIDNSSHPNVLIDILSDEDQNYKKNFGSIDYEQNDAP